MKSSSFRTHHAITRREFLAVCAASGVAYRASGSIPYRGGSSPELRMGIVVPDNTDSAASMLRGIELGLDEGVQTAAMFGLAVRGEQMSDPDAVPSDLVALIGGTTEAECRRLGELAAGHGILFLNAGCGSDALRSSATPNTFHIAASERMLADAVAHAAGAKAGAHGLSAVSWHSSLTRFGAEQLNARFRSRFGIAMDGDAWSGWAAVKILVECALRCKNTAPVALRAYLELDTARFDGHKGTSLSFERKDHQLRQPVYVLESDGNAAAHVIAES